jgi:hypothetical protein
MTAGFRQWREDTHGTAGELVRHFLARFFDNEMIAIPGEWQKVAVSLFAAIVSVAITAALIYRDRYLALHWACCGDRLTWATTGAGTNGTTPSSKRTLCSAHARRSFLSAATRTAAS